MGGGTIQLPGGPVTANPVSGTKEWKQSMTADLRIMFVHKLMEANFLNSGLTTIMDERMDNVVSSARKAEGDIYEMASTRDEYYYLLVEKMVGVTANPVSGTKKWKQPIKAALRNFLVEYLVQAITTNPDIPTMLDKRLPNLMAFTRKVERDICEKASTRSEYCYLFAKKVNKFHKAIQESAQKRKEKQRRARAAPRARAAARAARQVALRAERAAAVQRAPRAQA